MSLSAVHGNAEDVVPAALDTTSGTTLDRIRSRGHLICGVYAGTLHGFSAQRSDGVWHGFDIDFCRAVAAATLGSADKVVYRPVSIEMRSCELGHGEIDVLIRNTTWTLTRDAGWRCPKDNVFYNMSFAPTTFYDGIGFLLPNSTRIKQIEDLNNVVVCVKEASTTYNTLKDFKATGIWKGATFTQANSLDQLIGWYEEGVCQVLSGDTSALVSIRTKLKEPSEHYIGAFRERSFMKEPLGPLVLSGDSQWSDIVTWVVYAIILAEEFGISQGDVTDYLLNPVDPVINRLMGLGGSEFNNVLQQHLGLEPDAFVHVISQVGNYDDIYNRNLGWKTGTYIPRGPNRLYSDGGLLYAPPLR